MVAQTKADARSVADKPVAAGKNGVQKGAIVDSKELLDDQAVAAAVVDAEQADAVAAQVVAEGGVLPTDAPIQSIGEMAQAPAPTTTDTTTAATTPPPVAEETAPMSPWAIGGVALLGVGAIAAVANDDDDDNDDSPPVGEEPPPAPPPATPPPVQPPAPPANTAPTSSDPAPVATEADGSTKLAAANFPFADAQDAALTSVKIGAITATPVTLTPGGALQIDAATGHGYELVSDRTLTWNEAQAFAAERGGYLAVLDTPAEMLFINTSYDGLGGPSGADGTWVGASQATGSVGVADGWTWNVGVPVSTVPGTPIPADSELWNDSFGGLPLDNGDGENGSAQFGAIYDGLSQTDTKLLYDNGTATDSLPKFLIEYDAAASPLKLGNAAVTEGQVIAADQLANLTWNSVFTDPAGSVKFSVGDSAGAFSTPENTLTFAAAPAPTVTFDAAQSVSTLIDDQHLSVLA